MMIRLLSAVVLFLILLPGGAGAQAPLEPLRVRISPEIPGPNTPVAIELEDATGRLGDATFTWTLDGSVALSGPARRSFSFTTGPIGKATRVSVRVERDGAVSLEREFVFRPALVRLMWEADTYTPPFYRGKALASPGADIRIFAFTDVRGEDGRRIPDEDLVFEWEQGGTKFADRSGLGVTSFTLAGNQLKSGEGVAVVVRTRDGTRAGRGSTFIEYADPLVRVYERHPLRGVRYERSFLSRETVASQELALVAEPYFFSTRGRDGADLVYEWLLNGDPVENQGSVLALRDERGGGEAALSVSVQNRVRTRLLQAAESLFGVSFREQSSSFF